MIYGQIKAAYGKALLPFVSKYQLYLPDRQTLQDKLTELLQNSDEQIKNELNWDDKIEE